MKTFVTRCKVGEYVTEAEGNSKKISRQKAAEMMLKKLSELPPLPPSIVGLGTKMEESETDNDMIKVSCFFTCSWVLQWQWK